MNRRGFLGSLATALAAGGAWAWRNCAPGSPLPAGEIVGASDALGHRLRAADFPEPRETSNVSAVIVGAGVAGLSAGWTLLKRGFSDFVILELEPEPGGNARFGRNAVTAYPWGAHYLPFPTQESRATRELLADFGVLSGDPLAAEPAYDERYINFAPQERLYARGIWREGLWPQVGIAARDRDQYRRFQDLMADFQRRRGADGAKAFAIPIDFSARDPDLLALDRLSMRDFLLQHGLDSEPLHWYVNYACRDDYGCRSDQTSAWMGIHYFASRDARARDAGDADVLTWPQGNGWLIERLRERLTARLVTDALVWRISEHARTVQVDAWNPREQRSTRYRAQVALWAAPVFQVPRVLRALAPPLETAIGQVQYAPWLVANLTLRGFPEERRGAPLSWDNVLYDSDALGYVVATHQHLAAHRDQTVFTWYQALCDGPPDAERQRLLQTPWSAWAERILADLSRPHPDIRRLVSRLDVMRWGHAMVRPRPGFVWSEARQRLEQASGRVLFAHSDLSGYSIFEEANHRGTRAAERALAMIG
ncbi:MAG: NAD(P)-binding protein [Candidatus Competibacter sp.]|nr:NAD(P)-binding protein [Candidatus Competibacter sp.]